MGINKYTQDDAIECTQADGVVEGHRQHEGLAIMTICAIECTQVNEVAEGHFQHEGLPIVNCAFLSSLLFSYLLPIKVEKA